MAGDSSGSRPVTVAIIGVGGLGGAISQEICDSDPNNQDYNGYNRIEKLLVKGRDTTAGIEKVKKHIDYHLLPRLDLRKAKGLDSLVIQQATAQQIAKEADLVFMCLEHQYGESKGNIPFNEFDFRKMLFNGNIGPILDYADIFKGSKAFVTFLTNPMLLAHRFYQKAGFQDPGQVLSFTADTERVKQALKVALPGLNPDMAEAFILGDHGERSHIVVNLPPSLAGLSKYIPQQIQRARDEAIEQGLDVARLFGSTTNQLLPYIRKYIKAVLCNTEEQFVLGAYHEFPEGKLFSQVPLKIVEKSGVFRAVVDASSLDKHVHDKKYVEIRNEMRSDAAQVEKEDRFQVRHSRPLVRTWYENRTLKSYNLRNGSKPLELKCNDPAFAIATLEDRVVVHAGDGILIWNASKQKTEELRLKNSNNLKFAMALRPNGVYVSHEVDQTLSDPSLSAMLLHYETGKADVRQELFFVPTALALGERGLYCADQDDHIRLIDPNAQKEIAIYEERMPLEGNVYIDTLSTIPRDEKNHSSEEIVFGVSTHSPDRPLAQVAIWYKEKIVPTVFNKGVMHGAFDAKRDRWDKIVVFRGDGCKVHLEMLTDSGVLKEVQKPLNVGYDIYSVCFDRVDNYLYVATKTQVIAIPYWKLELLGDKIHRIDLEQDVRDVRVIRPWL